MKKTRILITGAALAIGFAFSPQAMADVAVVVNAADSPVPFEFPIETVQAIKFPASSVEVLAGESYSWAMNQVTSIKFAINTSGISAATMEKGSLKLRKQGQVVYIDGLTAESKPGVEIYSLTGAKIYDDPTWKGEGIDVAHMAPGVYILKTNNSTFKFIR